MKSNPSTRMEKYLQLLKMRPAGIALWQLVYFLLLWQSIFRVSNAALSILLKFLIVFFHYSGLNFTKIQPNVGAA